MVLLGSQETLCGFIRNQWRLGYINDQDAVNWLDRNPLPEISSEEPQELGEGRVWVTGSKSRPGKMHVTVLTSDGEFVCTCEGAMYNGRCRHSKEIKESLSPDNWE